MNPETSALNLSSLIYTPPSYFEPLDLEAIFASPKPLEVELGSGDGSFLVQYAQAHPERRFLGVERLLGRLRKIDRKGRRAGLHNLRALRIEAGYFVEYLLPPQSVRALHVYFPDPWPKRKHWKNRLITERFTTLTQRILEPGGTVFLRTDSADYFAQMTTVFGANPAYEKVETPTEFADFLTDFERGFHAQGIETRRAAYRLAAT